MNVSLRISKWISASTLEQFPAFVADLDRHYEKNASSQGLNAVLGYKIIFSGDAEGGTQIRGPFISGLVELYGVGVKIKYGLGHGALPQDTPQKKLRP